MLSIFFYITIEHGAKTRPNWLETGELERFCSIPFWNPLLHYGIGLLNQTCRLWRWRFAFVWGKIMSKPTILPQNTQPNEKITKKYLLMWLRNYYTDVRLGREALSAWKWNRWVVWWEDKKTMRKDSIVLCKKLIESTFLLVSIRIPCYYDCGSCTLNTSWIFWLFL